MTGPGPHNAGSTPQPPQAPQELHEGPPASGGSRRNLIVAVAVIALIVVIGLVVWLVTKKSPDHQGAPQTGSIQQPAVSSAGGYTPIDPASMIAPGLKVPTNTDTFLDQVALPNFMEFAQKVSEGKPVDPNTTSCWYGISADNKWLAPIFRGSTGYIVCGPTRNQKGTPTWWTHEVSVDANGIQSLVKADGVPGRWSPAGQVPVGFRPDGRPLSAAG